jgi:hypothetical protein
MVIGARSFGGRTAFNIHKSPPRSGHLQAEATMYRNLSIFLAGAIAVTSAAGSFGSAAAMPRMLPTVVTDSGVAIEKVRKRQRVWRHRGGHAYWRHNRHRGYRHYGHGYHHFDHDDDDDFEAAAAFGLFGLAAGALLGSALSGGYGPGYYGNGYYGNGAGYYGNNAAGYGNDDVACAQKYRSYDPASGTYLGYDGYRHECVLP